jgi:hypothetical protein
MKRIVMNYGVMIPAFLCVIFSVRDILINPHSQFWATIILRNCLVFACGWQMLGFAVGHLFFADQIAEYIGLPKGHLFQLEVGVADLGMGIAGIMCGWLSGLFWLAVIINICIFLWGCAIGHIKEMRAHNNRNPGNAGYVFWWDSLIPIALITLGALHFLHGMS